MASFPKFDSYVCVGDTVKWQKDGFDLCARIEYDKCTKPTDYDCYSPIKIKQWGNGEWFFCGIVLSVSKNGIEILEHASSLWGIDCNYNARSNSYLSTVAKELESEALQNAEKQVEKMLEALQV